MAVLRISIAGLLLVLVSWAEPSPAQKEWALATSGVLNELNHRRHDVLGERTTTRIAEDQRALVDYWGIRSRADLLDQIEWLYQDRKTKLRAGWDYPRAIMLARWGYTIGYLSGAEAWKFICPLSQRLQRTFSSWQEFGAHFFRTRQTVYSRYARDLLFTDHSPLT